MNSYSQTFTEIDSAWIIFTELAGAIACVLWFLENRKTAPFPTPQLMLVMGFILAVNLFGRAWHKEWFSLWDKALYTAIAVLLWQSYVNSRHRNKLAVTEAEALALRTGVPVPVDRPDFFDRIENQVVWGLGIGAFAWTLLYVNTIQTESKRKDAAIVASADTARAHAEQKSAAQLGVVVSQVNGLTQQVAIVQGQNDTIMDSQKSNVEKVLEGQNKTRQLSNRNTKKIQGAIQGATIDTRQKKPKSPESESPDFWRRVRKQFGLSVRADTMSYALPPDSLINYSNYEP